ncbi:MAG TPA: hypothetical protein VMV07_27475 [Streptosporangiaceae bacterium]|nr:hypothetical protein [Streptosporangiaceae bacterium]
MKPRAAAVIAVVAAVLGLCACGGPSTAVGFPSSAATPAAATASHRAHHARAHRQEAARPHRARHHRVVAGRLLAAHDPGEVTGTVTGPCQTRDHGQLPDPSCTPGAFDPAVTQANIQSTICQTGYTDSVRPPESQTETFKWNVAEPAYGQQNVSGELDHLVPLELGGANDAANLWVEAGQIPNAKDAVENALNQTVCNGQITLRAAQQEIARNWIKAAATLGISVRPPGSQPSASARPSPTRAASAWCSATVSYNSGYADWDVYVHSDQPDTTVTVSSGGYSHTWHTDSSGSADVYLRGPSPGQTIDVTLGSANCSATSRR